MQTTAGTTWTSFQALNASRRSVRDFTGEPIPDNDMQDIFEAAMLAPSSANSQPYELHWVKDPAAKALVAKACNSQRAAMTATYLVVVVASKKITRNAIDRQLDHIRETDQLDERTRAYHLKNMKTMRSFLNIGGLPVWSPLLWIIRQLMPVFTLFPLSPAGMRQWMARNAIYAAQNMMLAVAAKGYDSCPMEGFKAPAIAKILGLSYGSVIPVVIAIGKRAGDAKIDPQWRKPVNEAIIVH